MSSATPAHLSTVYLENAEPGVSYLTATAGQVMEYFSLVKNAVVHRSCLCCGLSWQTVCHESGAQERKHK